MTEFAILQNMTPRCHNGFFYRYGKLTDEMYAQILRLIDPTPFTKTDFKYLLGELDPKTKRKRGFPSGGIAERKKLAIKIRKMDIPQMTCAVRDALCARLETGIRYTDTMYDMAAHRIAERARYRMFLRGVKSEVERFFDDPKNIPTTIAHGILGEIAVPERELNESPNDHRFRVIAEIMSNKLHYQIGSVGTLQNIAAINQKKIVIEAV